MAQQRVEVEQVPGVYDVGFGECAVEPFHVGLTELWPLGQHDESGR